MLQNPKDLHSDLPIRVSQRLQMASQSANDTSSTTGCTISYGPSGRSACIAAWNFCKALLSWAPLKTRSFYVTSIMGKKTHPNKEYIVSKTERGPLEEFQEKGTFLVVGGPSRNFTEVEHPRIFVRFISHSLGCLNKSVALAASSSLGLISIISFM